MILNTSVLWQHEPLSKHTQRGREMQRCWERGSDKPSKSGWCAACSSRRAKDKMTNEMWSGTKLSLSPKTDVELQHVNKVKK